MSVFLSVGEATVMMSSATSAGNVRWRPRRLESTREKTRDDVCLVTDQTRTSRLVTLLTERKRSGADCWEHVQRRSEDCLVLGQSRSHCADSCLCDGWSLESRTASSQGNATTLHGKAVADVLRVRGTLYSVAEEVSNCADDGDKKSQRQS